jgi:hypothetical protein
MASIRRKVEEMNQLILIEFQEFIGYIAIITII